jgi:hypothetical protein
MAFNNLIQVDYLVYIAGIAVPASTVSVSAAFNTCPECSVTLPPDHRLLGLGTRDRVPVQVFVSNTLCEAQGATKHPEYLLLFDGWVTTLSYQSGPLGKNLHVQATAVPSFMKDVSVRILTAQADTVNHALSAGNIGSAAATHLQFPSSLFHSGLSATGTIERPYDILENALNFIISEEQVANSPAMAFYKQYCDSTRMLDRCAKVPYFDTDDGSVSWAGSVFPLLAGLQGSEAAKITANMAQHVPVQTLYSLLNYMVASLSYELAFFAAPAYVDGKMVETCLKPLMYGAVPPPCNYIFRSHLAKLSIQDAAALTPTRIIFQDVDSQMQRTATQIKSGSTSQASIQALGQSFWPVAGDSSGAAAQGANPSSRALITDPHDQTESYCGPRIFETTAPPWMTYLPSTTADASAIKTVCTNAMKHIYYLKQHEHQTGQVQLSFNPYISSGFPVVVFDHPIPGIDTPLTLIGQALAVHHTLSKTGMHTTIDLGFTRTAEEDEENPLPALLDEITTDIYQEPSAMATIYAALLGTSTTPLTPTELIADDFGDDALDPQQNPREAYKYNARSITTMEEYADFMGLTAPTDDFSTFAADSDYHSNRWDTELQDKLASDYLAAGTKSIFNSASG